ncbi:MAG: class I SAM-dependent methyltransferase family protein [Haloarculaceae archaeon]
MTVPCVRVPREAGEAARTALADADLLDGDHEIVVEDGFLYIPVRDAAAVPEDCEVVRRTPPQREGQVMPADVLGRDPSYERLGDVAIVDEDDPDTAREVADAIVNSALPVRTVLNRASKVKGTERLRDWEVLAGDGTETVHREYGYEFALDLETVYFSPRLATERHRVVEQVAPAERVVDMFAGVGPFAIPMADRGAEVLAVDVNPEAIGYLRENAARNGVEAAVTAIEGDISEVAADYGNWADRLVMNLPHSADEFLDAAVTLAGDECVLHYYDIQSDADPFGPGEAAIRAAADPAGYEVTVETRREVRSYAPHELNVCLDVRLTRP